ncbi:MAG: hypothetical protein J0G29_05955, partial [Alphaproteobacteria bacterium]|nr:hypothetical protein [Alphaproteobacteria bacterium]
MVDKESLCSCLALYDLDVGQIDYKGLFYELLAWIHELGYTPVRASVDGEGINHHTTKTFKYVKKLMEERDFKGLTGFWLGVTPPDHKDDSFDSFISAGISTDIRANNLSLYVNNAIMDPGWEYVEELATRFLPFLPCRYGIGYQWKQSWSPSFYAVGILGGLQPIGTPEADYARDMISRWFHNYGDPKYWRTGMLRDVYPLNFLSQAHLANQVEGMPFDQWVASDLARGTLNPLTDSMWS